MGKYIAALIISAIVCILLPILFMTASGMGGWILLVLAIALFLYILYLLIKKAVKDALREYDEEKAKANGQK